MALEALSRLVNQFESQPRWRVQRQFRQVLAYWPQVVGAAVIPQTQPVRIEHGVLFVAVKSPTWGQTLTFERVRILEKLNGVVTPALKDIRFSTGDWFRRSPSNRDNSPLDEAGLRSHPSFVPSPERAATVASPQTVTEAYQQWAEWHQQAARHQATCPRCTCPCPQGELKRWQVCSVCAAKSWSSSQGR